MTTPVPTFISYDPNEDRASTWLKGGAGPGEIVSTSWLGNLALGFDAMGHLLLVAMPGEILPGGELSVTHDQNTQMAGLAPFTESSRPGEQYYDKNTEQVWEVIGWITQPAAILENLTTGERHVEIIGCENAKRFKRVSDA